MSYSDVLHILLTTSVLCVSCLSSAVFVFVAVYFPAGDHCWHTGLHYLPRGEVFYLMHGCVCQYDTTVYDSFILFQYFAHAVFFSFHLFLCFYISFFFSIVSVEPAYHPFKCCSCCSLCCEVFSICCSVHALVLFFSTLLTPLFLPPFSCSSVSLSATR